MTIPFLRRQNQSGTDPEKRRNFLYRILTLLLVPACGFLSAGAAYLGFYQLDSNWPWLVLPSSIAVIGLMLYEGLTESKFQKIVPEIPTPIFNPLASVLILIFSGAFVGWLYYLIEFIELHK